MDLSGVDSIRARPEMHIGNLVDASGPHRMLLELLHNALAEVATGSCNHIEIELKAKGALIRDNGRGIPVDIHPEYGVSAAEVIMTQLHAASSGVSLAVVNALSEMLELTIWRDRREHFMRFNRGYPEASLAVSDHAGANDKLRHGTQILFIPDRQIFGEARFDFEHIRRELEQLHTGDETMTLKDERQPAPQTIVLLATRTARMERALVVDAKPDDLRTLCCSFCGKSQHEVGKLVAGPTASICNECIDLCHEIIRAPSPE